MQRRTFLAGLPATLIAVKAEASTRKARKSQPVTSLSYGGKPRLTGMTVRASGPRPAFGTKTGARGSHILSLNWSSSAGLPADATFGVSFGDVPKFRQGVTFWRYAPWKSWTKPMAMATAGDLQADDVQCAYWQYDDGVYAVALHLGGGGFRTTLGSVDGKLATMCRALGPNTTARTTPQLAIGFGTDLYAVMNAVFEDAMTALGTPENLCRHKTLPEALTWLGWNTWNASNLGHDLSAAWVQDQVDVIQAAGAPIRSVVLDDGWFQHRDSRLQNQAPDPAKFPGGFKPTVDALSQRGIRHVGVWHAFDAYWNGIDPDSALGRQYAGQMFSWAQKPSPVDTSGAMVTYSFLKPDPAILDPYFDGFYAGLKAAGLSLVKVDNQLVAERMAKGNYPVWDLATALHGAINRAAAKHFDNALINCMDMTNDAFLNFGTTAVARSVEDYFPWKPHETYDLQEGNAAAHVLQAMYNALYFGEMVFPDFDMFESTNPNAGLHASVRAANCAPIYVTDKAGDHDVDLLNSLVDQDGRTLRADTPLRPTADCLFQVQAPKLFKAWSRVGDGALLLLANLADAPSVSGEYRLDDVPDLPKGDYAVYWFNRRAAQRQVWDMFVAVDMDKRFAHDLVRIAPIRDGLAVLGLADKRNGLASVSDIARSPTGLSLTARDGGTLLLWCDIPVRAVRVDGAPAPLRLDGNLLKVALENGSKTYNVVIDRV
ncbi:MAG: alpha-galactosidase [Asticcacaulis sp.]|nr:alpha-galactosidase [Asticcacaulis sp.]